MMRKECPLCGASKTKQIFTKGDLNKPLSNVICTNCSLVYIDQLLDDYEKYQADSGIGSGHHRAMTDGELHEKLTGSDARIKRGVVQFLKPYLKPKMKVLDIGCGFGNLLNIIREETGIEGEGVEINKNDVVIAEKKFNLLVYNDSLEQLVLQNDKKYDLIILHHTLEHFHEPLKELASVKRLLAPGGIFYIGVPNIMRMKKRPELFFIQGHACSYSPFSLNMMLKKADFKMFTFTKYASYPGGMDVLAIHESDQRKEFRDKELLSGGRWRNVKRYILIKKQQFKFLRMSKAVVLFWAPTRLRNKIGKSAYKVLRRL